MSSPTVIQIENISKSYAGAEFPAVNNVSFSIQKNEVFGLLGPNGAGKTTIISLLCGLFPPSSGKITINGSDLQSELSKVKNEIGVVPQDIALYPTLTGRENLEFYGTMYKVAKKDLKERIDLWLEKLEMSKSADKRVSSYSGGMKRRINLIAGILHNPSILFLDEPTVGVDVQSRAAIMLHLKELNASGMTIIYTSHHLEEAEKFCTDVAIIDNGHIITRGNPIELINENEGCKNLEEVFLKLTKIKLRD
ncbi:MAG: ABC transporter ATP-binding protein [Crocinitomicaceae bacterium]|nr:ABC transporter ATP-binding protein [Crocinitomicaceae bacterium]